MKRFKSLLFMIPAALFAGLLCYAVFNALAIYIPQQRERKDFAELKESVQASIEEAGERVEEAEENAANDADLPNPYRTLQERNGDFVGWLKNENTLNLLLFMKIFEYIS